MGVIDIPGISPAKASATYGPGGSAWRSGTAPNTSGVTVKASGEGSPGLFDLFNDDTTGYLFHLHTGPNSGSAAAALGIGTDKGSGTGLLISHKNAGIGLQLLTNPSATGEGSRFSGYAPTKAPLRVDVYAGATEAQFWQQNGAGYADGASTNASTTFTSATAAFVSGDVGATLSQLTSRGEGYVIPAGTTITAVTNSTTVTLSQACTGTATGINFLVGGRVPSASQLNAAFYSNTGNQFLSIKPTGVQAKSNCTFQWYGSGANPPSIFLNAGSELRWYQYNTGTNYYAHYWIATGNTFRLRSYATAAVGSESSYTEMMTVQKDALSFFGATPVARPSVGAAATDATSTQTLANNLRTALINLGLVTT